MSPGRRRFGPRVLAAVLSLLAASDAMAQAGPPIKNAVSNACAFDADLGRSGRCASAGEVVSWSVFAQNPDSSNPMLIGVRDGAPTPAACFTYTCPPVLLVGGAPTPLPPGSTCDPVAGFDIAPFSVPGAGFLEVQFETTLSGALAAGSSCENLASIVFPWGPVPTMEPASACQVDRGGSYPTIIDICGGSTGAPRFELTKTAETPGGVPLGDIEDGAAVCWRFHIGNAGTAPGTADLADIFDAHLIGMTMDPADPFATGTCQFMADTLACTGITVAAGASDEARACGTFRCTNGQLELCNGAALVLSDPPSGDLISSRPCPTCAPGPTCLSVAWPDFSASTKSATHVDVDRDGCLGPGDRVSFEITASNTGAGAASDVSFVDTDPPEGRDAGDCTWSVGGGPFQACPAAPGVGWSLGSMSRGDRPVVIRWSVTMTSAPVPPTWCDQGGSLVAAECGASRNMPDTCLPACAFAPDVQGATSCTPQSVRAGERVGVVIDACNEGSAPATNVILADLIPPCAQYIPGTLAAGVGGAAPTPRTDAGDGDGATWNASSGIVAIEVQDLLGRDLQPGECVQATFQVAATTCPTSGFVNLTTITADGMSRRNTSGCLVDIVLEAPQLSVWKTATPDPIVSPGGLVTYTLRTCNAGGASADGTDVVVTDDVPACIDFEAGTLQADGRRLTDAADGDVGELQGGSVVFHAARLAPGECMDFTWQGRADMSCGGTLVTNRASFTAEGVVGGLSSNETSTAIATYVLEKSAADTDGGRLVAGDEVEWSIRYCNGSPLDLLQVDVTDFVSSVAGTPASDCPVTYVAESMSVQVDGQPAQPLTDRTLDDLAHFDPGPPAFIEVIVSPLRAATCFVVRFRVRLDAGCLPGDCVRDVAHAQFTSPLQEIDSNLATACTGALLDGELMRGVGVGALVPTGGCDVGPRLLEFACSELPGICRVDVPGVRWTMLRDAETRGEPVTFYEFPGGACCAAVPSDDAHLVVRKSSGARDLLVEIVPSCR